VVQENSEQQIKLVEKLRAIMASGKVSSGVPLHKRIHAICSISLRSRKHEVVTVKKEASQEQASGAIREIFRRIALGSFKEKSDHQDRGRRANKHNSRKK